MKRILRWLAIGVAGLVAIVVVLDTFGGRLLDGPLGPIPGGTMSGTVDPSPNPKWADLRLPEVIELEIRPEKPWSLSVWNVVVDGELYVPSFRGASRRWTKVAIADPLARTRVGDTIYERSLYRVTDPELQRRIAVAVSERYTPDREPTFDERNWYFHLAPRR